MSFIHSAFIENSKEAREWLESIGYDMRLCDNYNEYTCAGIDGVAFTTDSNYPSFRLFIKEKAISCLGNFNLFKAISAMREDSDYMQWFYNQYYNEWSICEQRNMFDYFNLDWCIHARKVSLDELINHFKK